MSSSLRVTPATRVWSAVRVAALAAAAFTRPSLAADRAVRFGRDVLPILSAHCYACHGPDEKNRKAKLRLDQESDAKAPHKDGTPVIPGDPARSALAVRISSADPEQVMPPPEANKPLKPAEVATLKRWIAQGGAWGKHWSFEPIVRPNPAVAPGASPIDALVDARLKDAGIRPEKRAEPHVLARRLWLDLTGVPPTPEEADLFAAAPSREAYGKLVDAALDSPQFGEHWARMWLDLARYADTKGYEKDLGRTMWPYRDWVVRAFNRDLPLDRFTEEQLAGDLLPGADDDQIIATAFHRNTMTNDEGGTDDEEFRVAAVKDRVDTTVQVWMGLTMGCAKCHSHKYDPISQSEYYGFYALFNQTEDADRYDDAPLLTILTPARKGERRALESAVDARRAELSTAESDEAGAGRVADELWRRLEVIQADSAAAAKLAAEADGAIRVTGPRASSDTYTVALRLPPGAWTALRLEVLPVRSDGGSQVLGRNPDDPNFVLSEFTAELATEGGEVHAVAVARVRADFEQDGWPASAAADGKTDTGWAVSPRKSERHSAIFELGEALKLTQAATLRVHLVQKHPDGLLLAHFRLSASSAEPASLDPLGDSPAVRSAREALAGAERRLKTFEEGTPRMPILKELGATQRRETRIHRRGSFLDPGDPAPPGVPAAFGALPAGAPLNRLGVARWLTGPENTLTARVWANRVWARLFGVGIVETEEDFGALGAAPTNPELLDWLAAEYRDNGWSLKRLLRTIALSETYQRAARADAAGRKLDPRNLLWGRGARYRLSAETIRDQALAAAGLLSLKMGGPPVMPPQPAGLWRSTYSGQQWVDEEGENRWRRGLYTYWKRTTPYPSMIAFDAGSREVCQIRRFPSNTPLQALVTLNDPVYLEAAGALARRMVAGGATPAARAARGLRLALLRPVSGADTDPIVALQHASAREFAGEPERASKLVAACRAKPPEGMTGGEFAGWIVAANAVLNLDEFLTRH